MRPRSLFLVSLVIFCGLVVVLNVAAVLMTQHYLDIQVTQGKLAPVVEAPQVPMKTVVVAVLPPGPGEGSTLSAVVDDGMRAMSVRINDVLGVAGFVLPGDRVDIMLTRGNFTDILLQNVKILAIGQSTDERAEKPSLAKTATVEVNTVDAQKLTLAQTVGTLSLALRAAGSVEAAAPRRITMGDLGPAYEIYADAQEEKSEAEIAVERRIKKVVEEFNRKTWPINDGLKFNPNVRCAAAVLRHPFAGRHPCFPE